jgi:hypothetical protein
VGRVREQAKRAKCMSNVRQITISLVNHATSNKNQAFPDNPETHWAWDVYVNLANSIANQAGRDVFYCPSSNMLQLQPMEKLFPYQGNTTRAVTGYVLLIPKTQQVEGKWLNDRLKSEYEVSLTSSPNSLKVRQPASRRALVVDAVISDASGTNFTTVPGGFDINVSNHMSGSRPMGGHTGYVGGNVKWRPFVAGSNSTDQSTFTMKTTSGLPTFWF